MKEREMTRQFACILSLTSPLPINHYLAGEEKSSSFGEVWASWPWMCLAVGPGNASHIVEAGKEKGLNNGIWSSNEKNGALVTTKPIRTKHENCYEQYTLPIKCDNHPWSTYWYHSYFIYHALRLPVSCFSHIHVLTLSGPRLDRVFYLHVRITSWPDEETSYKGFTEQEFTGHFLTHSLTWYPLIPCCIYVHWGLSPGKHEQDLL